MAGKNQEQRHGAIGVVYIDGRYLVIQRASTVEAPGAYCFPGGHIGPDESSQAAVVRELHEELGVDCQARELLWQSVTEWNVHLDWWKVELKKGFEIQANLAEVAQVLWLTPAEMRELDGLLSSNLAFLEWREGRMKDEG